MCTQELKIGTIPAVLYGEPAPNIWLFVHGQGGNKTEAAAFAALAAPTGWQVLGIDLPEHGERTGETDFTPWQVVPELQTVLICDMMQWAKVTPEQLCEKGEITTEFGQTLSWRYLCWVRQHPLDGWQIPTAILYAGQDTMTSRDTVTAFAQKHHAELTVYEPGEHWFHTPAQLDAMQTWERAHR